MANQVNVSRFGQANLDLARYDVLSRWTPAVSDFIVYHGLFFRHWYGIINSIDNKGRLSIIKEGLPKLLLTMSEEEYEGNTIIVSTSKIKGAMSGAYSVLQNGVWYI